MWSVAPGGAAALAVLAVVVSFAGVFWYFWQGAAYGTARVPVPEVLRAAS